jgi:hypothetical protein
MKFLRANKQSAANIDISQKIVVINPHKIFSNAREFFFSTHDIFQAISELLNVNKGKFFRRIHDITVKKH